MNAFDFAAAHPFLSFLLVCATGFWLTAIVGELRRGGR
jgi:hypothetical protein